MDWTKKDIEPKQTRCIKKIVKRSEATEERTTTKRCKNDCRCEKIKKKNTTKRGEKPKISLCVGVCGFLSEQVREAVSSVGG